MRYRLLTDWTDGNVDLGPVSSGTDYPLVHVFRDDELDELASAIVGAVYAGIFREREAVLDVLRNHTSERQPDSADGAG